MSTPLIIDPGIRDQLRKLCALAHTHPVEMIVLMEQIQTPEGKARHMEQMTLQSILIRLAFMVTFSIERGHPEGTCRHLSMSVDREGRVPSQQAVWMVAQELGFWGGLENCAVWIEELLGHGRAVNVVQPVMITARKTT